MDKIADFPAKMSVITAQYHGADDTDSRLRKLHHGGSGEVDKYCSITNSNYKRSYKEMMTGGSRSSSSVKSGESC